MKAVTGSKQHLSRDVLALYSEATKSYELAKDGDLPYALAKEHFEKVADLCQSVLERSPHHTDSLHLWARAVFELGQYLEATDLLEKALKMEPSVPALWYSYGYSHLALRSLETARTAFVTALKLGPNETRADLGLAHCLFLQEDWVGAFQHYRTLYNKYPQDRFVKQQIITVLSKLKADEYNLELESDLISYLSFSGLDVAPLSFFSSSLFHLKYPNISTSTKSLLPEFRQVLRHDPLLNHMLSAITVSDPHIERLLCSCRLDILLTFLETQSPLPSHDIVFCLNLAIHQQRTDHCLPIDINERRLLKEVESLLLTHPQMNTSKADADFYTQLLLVYSLFEPIVSMPETASRSCLLDEPILMLSEWPKDWSFWVQSLILEPLNIQKLADSVQPCSEIHHASKDVQAQYEQNPYPRWDFLPARTPNDYSRALQQQLMISDDLLKPALDGLSKTKLNVLIAGCGTGRHALYLAQNFEQLNITAVDLSRHSLGYALHKARELNAGQVRFFQGDILNLPQDWHFDIIECSGVLHHMRSPIMGLKRLCELLKPTGIIKIGLYSQMARRHLLALRNGLQHHCQPSLSTEALRSLRSSLLQHHDTSLMQDLLSSPDFYNLSGFRDLLLHVQEKDFSPVEIASLVNDAQIEFLGFSNLSESTKSAYKHLHPDDTCGLNLFQWQSFEQQYPNTFGHMYQFFCYKPA